MQVTWTGADATALRDALGLSQSRFAERAGIHLATVKKWAGRGSTIQLKPDFAAMMETMLKKATPEQRRRFFAISPQRTDSSALSDDSAAATQFEMLAEPALDTRSLDCAKVAHEIARRDLTLDRRQVSQALAGVVVGVHLLEPLEQWLLVNTSDTPPSPVVTGLGLQELDELENTARAFREWDDDFGGGLRRKAVIGQLDEVAELLGDNPAPPIKQRLRHILALLADTAATMSWDSHLEGVAQEYYGVAFMAAAKAGEPALCANAIAGMARQLLSLDHYGTTVQRAEKERDRAFDALELIRMALDRFGPRVTPTVRAMLHTREAWAYAKLQRPSAFLRAADKAYAAFSESNPTEDPYWVRYFDEAEIAGTLGGRLLELARHDSGFAGEAAQSIDQAIALRRPKRLRSSALDRLGIVEARLIEGELEEACRLGNNALAVVEQTGSHRVQRKLQRVYKQTADLTNVAAVAEFRDNVRPLVSVV